jgi:hypothetical protein
VDGVPVANVYETAFGFVALLSRLCTASSRMFRDASARRRMVSFADVLEATAWPIPPDPMMMVTVFEGWVSGAILFEVFATSVGCLYCLHSIRGD